MTTRSPAADRPPGWRTIGHEGASRFLQRSVVSGRLAHAFLITGPAHVGKAALALDLARAVNCGGEGPPAERPCGECAACGRITRGVHSDIVVIDERTPITGAAGAQASTEEQDSRRTMISIDHIREMQHRAALNSFEGGWRVFIIDGADRMSPEAPDALLKTLEEPPPNVLIVLLAQSDELIPETIVSRCQRVKLRHVPAEEIERALLDRTPLGGEEARVLAKLADGKPGRAFSAAEDNTALDRYRQAVFRVVGVIAGDLEERFRYAREMATEFQRDRSAAGRELDLWRSLWRDVLLLGCGSGEWVVNTGCKEALATLAGSVSSGEARSVIEAVDMVSHALDRNAQARLALEVMMLALPAVPEGAVLEDLFPGESGGEGGGV
ncbi:MAG: DNA polymerase III subunit [Dehalococcoidia bacterium]